MEDKNIHRLKYIGSILLAFGVVILAILVGLGFYAKGALHAGLIKRNVYKMPNGYEDPAFEKCSCKNAPAFENEHYLWNMTNPADFQAGSKPIFDMVGPFSYAQCSCEFDFELDKDAGIIKYRTYYKGYKYFSESSKNDTVKITNISPAYMGLVRQLGDDKNMFVVLGAPALAKIIGDFQNITFITRFRISSVPRVLTQVTEEITSNYTTQAIASELTSLGVSAAAFFDPNYEDSDHNLPGWTKYTLSVDGAADVSLSTDSQNQIFAAWTDKATLNAFMTTDDVATKFSVTTAQATALRAYISYVGNATFITQPVMEQVYTQWATGSNPTVYSGWELGKPDATNLAYSDVSILFGTGPCSLMNASTWQMIVDGVSISAACPDVFSPAVVSLQSRLVSWYLSFASGVVSDRLLKDYNLTDWNDFAYAQWGHAVVGHSLGPFLNLPYKPEVAYLFPDPPNGFSTKFAKSLLTGKNSLLGTANMVAFFGYAGKSDVDSIAAIWGLSQAGVFNFAHYISDVITPPVFQHLLNMGSGLVVTMTAREWLFTGTDPLLSYVYGSVQSSALLKNRTITRAEVQANNKTTARIFTGDNDLYWSLMPATDGMPILVNDKSPWNGVENVTGFNGTQFLPFGYIDNPEKEHPLNLYHSLVGRVIPFETKGSGELEGVKVRYMAETDDALASRFENPHNALYWSDYNGVINQTKFSGSPILTKVSFHGCSPELTENITLQDTLYPGFDPTDALSRHRYSVFVLAEPISGATVWGNLPIQANFRYTPTYFNPNVMGGFAPVYWNAIGSKATSKNLSDIKKSIYGTQATYKALIGVGFGLGIPMIVAGIVMIVYYRKHKHGEKIPQSPK